MVAPGLRIPLIFALLLKLLFCWELADAAEEAPSVPVVVATAKAQEQAPHILATGTVVSRADARLAAEVASAAVPAAGAPVPLVAQNLSKFAVVVECVELLPAPEPATP